MIGLLSLINEGPFKGVTVDLKPLGTKLRHDKCSFKIFVKVSRRLLPLKSRVLYEIVSLKKLINNVADFFLNSTVLTL